MAKAQKKKKAEVILTPAEKFQQYVTLKNATRCILGVEDEYKIYVRLEKDFANLAKEAEVNPFEGSEKCMELSRECAVAAEKLKAKLPTEKKEDSQTVTTTAKEREERAKLNGKTKKVSKTKIALILLAVLVVAFIVCYNVAPTRYLIAGAERAMGLEEWAMASYDKLGDYKDSPLQSDQTRLLIEKKMIKEAKKGSWISFGSEKATLTDEANQWVVLEKKDGVATLAKVVGISMNYHETNEKVTWDKSDLRNYLNGEFLDKMFHETERSCLLENDVPASDNTVYSVKGGEATKDLVFILDEEEYAKYKKALGEKANCIRLRTPGNDQTTTAYTSYRRKVVPYGIPVDDPGACVRPIIRVKFE